MRSRLHICKHACVFLNAALRHCGVFGVQLDQNGVAPETVGNLAASYHSIAVAPVHASTDLTPAFGAVDTDEAPVTVAAPIEKAEAPEIAPKTDGITTGTVR